MNTYNGMPAAELSGAVWRKSSTSNSQGACVELARLGTDEFAVRNSRNPDGPALIYTRAEIVALIEGVKLGEFDDLLTGLAGYSFPGGLSGWRGPSPAASPGALAPFRAGSPAALTPSLGGVVR